MVMKHNLIGKRGNFMKAINIKWDTDGNMELLKELPSEMEIPEGMTNKNEISDYLSDEIGFCHYGFDLMPRYAISVKEILKRTVIVEAENIEEAIKKVEEAVEREEIILDVDDYDGREIVPSEYWNGGKVPDGKDVS